MIDTDYEGQSSKFMLNFQVASLYNECKTFILWKTCKSANQAHVNFAIFLVKMKASGSLRWAFRGVGDSSLSPFNVNSISR